jgi:hypothetical protein
MYIIAFILSDFRLLLNFFYLKKVFFGAEVNFSEYNNYSNNEMPNLKRYYGISSGVFCVANFCIAAKNLFSRFPSTKTLSLNVDFDKYFVN